MALKLERKNLFTWVANVVGHDDPPCLPPPLPAMAGGAKSDKQSTLFSNNKRYKGSKPASSAKAETTYVLRLPLTRLRIEEFKSLLGRTFAAVSLTGLDRVPSPYTTT